MTQALVGAGCVGALPVPAGTLPPQLVALVHVHATPVDLRVHPEPGPARAIVVLAVGPVHAYLVAAAVALETGVVGAAGHPVVLELVPLGTQTEHLK